jgi:hypothetical protein
MKGGQEAIRFFMYIIFHLSCLSMYLLSLAASASSSYSRSNFQKRRERENRYRVTSYLFFRQLFFFFYFLLFWVFFSFGVGFIYVYNTSFHLNYSNVFGEEEKTGSNAFFKRVYIAGISLSRLSSPP